MIRSALDLGRQLLRGLSFFLVILVAAGAWAYGPLPVAAQAAASSGISLASLPDNPASVSTYDYVDDFARPPPVPPAAESGWVRRAFSGLEVLTYTPRGGAGLGDDLARALDDIDSGVPRPNVRNPKPFGNDGCGGTTPLPDLDSTGNPVSYVEHTVNARPPRRIP